MKKTLIAVLAMVMLLSLVACSSPASTPPQASAGPVAPAESAAPSAEPTKPEAKSYTIGVCAADLSNPYFVALIDGIQAKAKELGNVTVIVEDPKQDPAKQTTAIENFVSQKVDGIIMIPFDLTAANLALKDVYADGEIKILCQSGKIENANTNVAARDYDMGYALGVTTGKYIKEQLDGKAKIGMLNYPALESIIEREKGIIDGIKEFAPEAEVVATAQGGTPDAGTTATESFMQANPDISVIVSINDAGALGALAAIEGMNLKNDKFFIGGIDALDQALAEIKKGSFYRATVDITPFENGKFDLELMIKMLNGEQVEAENSIQVKSVTAANIADYQ